MPSTAFSYPLPLLPSPHLVVPLSCRLRRAECPVASHEKRTRVITFGQAGRSHFRPSTLKRSRGGTETRTKGPQKEKQNENSPFVDLDSKERLQKVLSRLGVASRREAENLMMDGKVKVNGRTVKELGTTVNVWKDNIVVDGKRVTMDQDVVWIAFYKPHGFRSTIHSPGGLSRFLGNIPSQSLIPISPIEDDAAGLVVLTNERGVVPDLSRPDHPHSKTWTVDCHGIVTQRQLSLMTSGVDPKDGIGGIMRADVDVIGSGKGRISGKEMGLMTRLEVRIRDSRRRVISRLCEAADLSVIRMVRRSFGPVLLQKLRPGGYRNLVPKEVKALKRGVNEKNLQRKRGVRTSKV